MVDTALNGFLLSICIKADCRPLVTFVTTVYNLSETGSCLWCFRYCNDRLFLEYNSCLQRSGIFSSFKKNIFIFYFILI